MASAANYAGIGTIPMPPARFDHKPALTPLVIYVENPDQFCRKVGSYAETEIYSCQGWFKNDPEGKGQCVIALPKHADKATLAILLRHERAHCNGWPASHPS